MAWTTSKNPNLSKWWTLYFKEPVAERAIEPAIASLGRRYRSQHPFLGGRYFGDFVLLDDRLIIEVDGDSHRKKGAPEADRARDERLAEDGWQTLRCTNAEALAAPYDTVDRLLTRAGLPWRTRRPG